MASRIEDYALIGDCETAALVARNGSIDWLCWPRFDSDACFAALLGTEENGHWQICAVDGDAVVSRRYRGDSCILETRFETASGAAVVVDFMSPRTGGSDIARIVLGERGSIAMRTKLVVRFGYGTEVPWVTRLEDGSLRAIAGPSQVVFRSEAEVHGEGVTTVGAFTVTAGQSVAFQLVYGPSHLPPPSPVDARDALADTERYWAEWAAKTTLEEGPARDVMMRSLLTLRALTYAPTGGIVAAPTTSLPETLGGIRNWDYRYCWLRDATLSLLALMNAGYYEEAAAWRDWLVRAVAGTPEDAQIMYGIAGERRLSEWEISWLPGYENSSPVRIGNAAHDQLQLDVFGEVMEVLYLTAKGGVKNGADGWSVARKMLSHLSKIWKEPDRGIWEIRSEPRHYVFSKVMAWVAFDRGVKMVEDLGLEGPADEWRATAAAIHADVCANGFDASVNSFVESYGTTRLDGSLLLIPTTGFLPATDPRIVSTVAAVEARLVVNGFVMRHDPSLKTFGLAHGEGAFLACSFWLADAYVLLDRLDDARALFDRLLAIRNDVGLLSEAYEVFDERQLGNFPQAFSHIGLLNTAQNLIAATKPAKQRAQ